MLTKRIIHLLSVAGSDRELPGQLGLRSADEVIEFVQQVVGASYRVTGNTRLMNTKVDERHGGRHDDAARIRELKRVLADGRIAAIVALRGGSWLTRILPHVNFDVLRRRRTVVHIFGFSEFTTLINIVSRYPCARAYYDLCPAYLFWSMKEAGKGGRSKFKREFAAFFEDLVGILAGHSSRRRLKGRLVQGRIPQRQIIRVVGGCLSVLVTLLASPLAACVDAAGKWLAIEDVGEEVHRIDRMLAQLKLAGTFERCAGLLVGDFNLDGVNQTNCVLELLKYHLPRQRKLPIIARCNFGHCYPFAGVPINQPIKLVKIGTGRRPACRIVPILR